MHTLPCSESVKEKFAKRLAALEVPIPGCWDWPRLSPEGYGYVTEPKTCKQYKAHRVAYELIVGPLPDGFTIDHLCRNRACVNPAHLEAVTNAVNILRGSGPMAVNARKTHCKRGHPLSGDNLTINAKGERNCRACVPLRRAKLNQPEDDET